MKVNSKQKETVVCLQQSVCFSTEQYELLSFNMQLVPSAGKTLA